VDTFSDLFIRKLFVVLCCWTVMLTSIDLCLMYFKIIEYSHALHNDVSFNDGPHILQWSHKFIIL